VNPLDPLIAAAGNWRGSNTLQDPQTGGPDESPSTAVVTPVLGGRFVRVDYTWAYHGQPQEGSLLVGHEPELGRLSGYWIDTWHMGWLAMLCAGTPAADGSIAVRGYYAAPPGPDWGWRISIAISGNTLKITHTNIDPEGQEGFAADASYSRT
jgi:hypothetical protein